MKHIHIHTHTCSQYTVNKNKRFGSYWRLKFQKGNVIKYFLSGVSRVVLASSFNMKIPSRKGGRQEEGLGKNAYDILQKKHSFLFEAWTTT